MNPDRIKGFLYLIKFEWFYDSFYLFHLASYPNIPPIKGGDIKCEFGLSPL
jgi:hypothetical protein